MQTLAVVIWLFAAIMLVKFVSVYYYLTEPYHSKLDSDDQHMFVLVTSIFGLGIVALLTWLFTLALFKDLYGIDLTTGVGGKGIQVAVFSGLVCLGVTSLTTLFLPWLGAFIFRSDRHKRQPKSNGPTVKRSWWVVFGVFELIGLLASVLGILSFYLDYLK